MKADRSIAIIGVILVACLSEIASAQSLPRAIRLLVSYKSEMGANGYGLEFFDGGVHFSSGVSITAPDGTVFQNGPGTPFVGVGSLTLSELTTRFAGDWTINDNWNLPVGAPTQHHRFSIDAPALSAFPSTTPEILSPTSGALLPYDFEVLLSSIGAMLLVGDNFQYSLNVPYLMPYVDVRPIPAVYPKVVEARASFFLPLTINVTPIEPSPTHRFSIPGGLRSFSAPVTWTIGVPEPSTIALTSFVLLNLAALRRRK